MDSVAFRHYLASKGSEISMEEATKELLPTLQLLLPGFLATIIFYWFADVPKPSQFERILQALVCTPIINLLVGAIGWTLIFTGQFVSVGVWKESNIIYYSICTSLVFGTLLAFACNKDIFFSLARKLKITSKASHSSHIHVFRKYGEVAAVLQLNDGRRIMGYIAAHPSTDPGSFYLLDEPHWLNGSDIFKCEGTASFMINADKVNWVEFTQGESNG
ncbi:MULTISPECIES: DUF6338 family protein [Pseudomonas]|nr:MULTISPECIES: DUF6338 family protein [Pseudomonas]